MKLGYGHVLCYVTAYVLRKVVNATGHFALFLSSTTLWLTSQVSDCELALKGHFNDFWKKLVRVRVLISNQN